MAQFPVGSSCLPKTSRASPHYRHTSQYRALLKPPKSLFCLLLSRRFLGLCTTSQTLQRLSPLWSAVPLVDSFQSDLAFHPWAQAPKIIYLYFRLRTWEVSAMVTWPSGGAASHSRVYGRTGLFTGKQGRERSGVPASPSRALPSD